MVNWKCLGYRSYYGVHWLEYWLLGPSLLRENITDHFVSIHVIVFNSIGCWYMNLSEYMGGMCLWKFNSIGVRVKESFIPQIFFSGIAPYGFLKNRVDFHFSQ